MPATESGIWVFVVIQDGKGSEIACGEMYEKATNVVSVILEMECRSTWCRSESPRMNQEGVLPNLYKCRAVSLGITLGLYCCQNVFQLRAWPGTSRTTWHTQSLH